TIQIPPTAARPISRVFKPCTTGTNEGSNYYHRECHTAEERTPFASCHCSTCVGITLYRTFTPT
ncbi:MAG: hypothetical protein ABR516_05560, partial [Desulfuromonadaceae bacterium]